MVSLRLLIAQVRFKKKKKKNEASFLIERLMLTTEVPRAYNIAAPSRIVLYG